MPILGRRQAAPPSQNVKNLAQLLTSLEVSEIHACLSAALAQTGRSNASLEPTLLQLDAGWHVPNVALAYCRAIEENETTSSQSQSSIDAPDAFALYRAAKAQSLAGTHPATQRRILASWWKAASAAERDEWQRRAQTKRVPPSTLPSTTTTTSTIAAATVSDSEGDTVETELETLDFWPQLVQATRLQVTCRQPTGTFGVYRLAGPVRVVSTKTLQSLEMGVGVVRYEYQGRYWIQFGGNKCTAVLQPDSNIVALCGKPKHVPDVLHVLETVLTCSVVGGYYQAAQRIPHLQGSNPVALMASAESIEQQRAVGRHARDARNHQAHPVKELHEAATGTLVPVADEVIATVTQKGTAVQHPSRKRRKYTLGNVGDCPLRQCVRWDWTGPIQDDVRFKCRLSLQGSDVWGGLLELQQLGVVVDDSSLPSYVQDAPSVGGTIRVQDGSVC